MMLEVSHLVGRSRRASRAVGRQLPGRRRRTGGAAGRQRCRQVDDARRAASASIRPAGGTILYCGSRSAAAIRTTTSRTASRWCPRAAACSRT